jgi:pimeloyl-ACP methyl ester carboxylesterase
VRWSEYTADVGGRVGRLHVRRVVDPAAPPVLLLHGLGVGGMVWQAFARRLLPELAAVAPDLRGHGQSDAPPDGYQPLDYATDIAALLAEESVPVPILGHSLGALVALGTAALEAKRVPWIVLLDPPLDPANRNDEIADVYRLRHAAPGELEAYLLDRNPRGGALLANVLAGLFRQGADRAFEVMLDRDTFHVPSVEQPTLILQADPSRGGVLGDEAAARAVAQLPHGELHKIEGAPHALHASHPDEVANAIKAFAAAHGD